MLYYTWGFPSTFTPFFDQPLTVRIAPIQTPAGLEINDAILLMPIRSILSLYALKNATQNCLFRGLSAQEISPLVRWGKPNSALNRAVTSAQSRITGAYLFCLERRSIMTSTSHAVSRGERTETLVQWWGHARSRWLVDILDMLDGCFECLLRGWDVLTIVKCLFGLRDWERGVNCCKVED